MQQKPIYVLCLWLLSEFLYFTHANLSDDGVLQETNRVQQYPSIESIQQQNLQLLQETLELGWKSFCEAPVDESVMFLHSGINPCDASIHVMTLTNQSIRLPIKAISEISDFDINPKRKTLIYVNAFYTLDSYFSVQAHLKLLQATRRDLNIVLVDFAKDVLQLYNTVRHHVVVQAHFVAKILNVLTQQGIAPEDITLAGHSVGANIAALAARIYASQATTLDVRMGQLVAIDPALMCRPSDIYVHANVSTRVVVIHGEGDVFGVRERRGTIDIYPNGIGFFSRRKLQPGCSTKTCSHMYAFVLFMEALIEGVMIPAVKCDSWSNFRRRQCDFSDSVAIGLKYPAKASGVYFCLTQANPPFTFMEYGVKYERSMVSRSATNLV
ncbi:pancreatic lipase-related protein 2-like [Anastrepha obliqua]|uniref:pancreatic lipase-related protein 2-like n=1 Tax=Anastrepha obliqua TaxID=95512 RepID=UPI0024095783|nr:pancreatic lipase-related protein 2-like [Anastrepha obliqua]